MGLQSERFGVKSGSSVRGVFLTLLAVLHQANGVFKCADHLNHQHCRNDPGGVHDLECFGTHLVTTARIVQHRCSWEPGGGLPGNTYTLLIKQPREWSRISGLERWCKVYTNITGTWANITVYEKSNMSVEIFESSKSGVCTKAAFQGIPKNFVRCGPPDSVSFSRLAGRLAVNVTWRQTEMRRVGHFAVRYRAQGGWLWSEPLQSDNATAATVESVNSSLGYTVQVCCVKNSECTQCLWSRAYDVPPELTTAPDLHEPEEADAVEMRGQRRISLTWKFTSKHAHDGYRVSLGKASGEEPRDLFWTTEPRITFLLSYSTYHLEISAFNSASTSPALRHTIERREDQLGLGTEEPNVTVHNNRSFTISLRENLMEKYVCYSAEWMQQGQKAAFMSYHSETSSRTLTLKNTQESLEPFRRYTLTLHVRPDKESCNMKHINSSESTYGSTKFYFLEGSPVGAPANISSYNVTMDSAGLKWSPIPEEDVQGFLLGHIIYYTENRGTRIEENVTVGPDVSRHMLEGLRSGTMYEVQISGFTLAGVGVRSEKTVFTTDHHDNSLFSGIIKFAAIMTTVLLFGCPMLKRAKRTLWPSIPNPEKSKMMQTMEMTNELELLQSIGTLEVEECDTNSLQIVQREQAIAACTSAEMPSRLDDSEDEFGDVQETHLSAAPLAGGYTTVEMFRQAVSASMPASQGREPEVTVLRSQMDYVRQFSTDSTWDSQILQWKTDGRLDRL